jgi:hypothetical protein
MALAGQTADQPGGQQRRRPVDLTPNWIMVDE